MSARGRDRFRRDYPQRSEEKSHHGRTSAPPSRHLWVGNLPPDINEKILANLFLKFGELEDLAYQPGRSYAFINFKYDREAFAAVSELQGFVVGGNRLRIEFAKAEKSTASLRDEDFLQHRDERWSKVRESPLLDRDTRIQHPSPDHSGKRKISDRDVDPSEVLWIGFPALLKVDEVILRKAFSPFGEIEKITVFPGRSYAFVRFKTIMAAARAKETLQGKLFGNPRVHICFAKSESGSSNTGKNSTNFDPYGRSGFSEDLRHDRKFKGLLGDPTAISPRFVPNLELDEHDNIMGFPRNEGFEHRRFDGRPEMGFPHQGSPMRERRPPQFRDFLPQHFLHKGPVDEDDWDLPEDNLLFHGNPKKVKTTIFPLENELPEFPLPSFDQGKHALPREFPDFPRDSEPGMIGYKQIPDRAMNLTPAYGDRTDHRGSYNRFEPGSGPLPLNTVERKRFTPEPPRLSEEWKWEGIIAKGGTPVCRARCFPKGKVLDMPLPEFLDCTARTGLDMLAKHYYQAASTWVVFFVPESDADIGFYNEFMHYLEEKQRAAVAKLDEQTTLFLVPPSEFSETVLKIPGKLSISGVILRLDQTRPVQNVGFPQHPHIREPMSILPRHGDASYPKPKSPPGSFPSMSRSGVADYMIDQRQNASGHNPNFGGKNVAPQSSTSGFDPAIQGYNPTMPRVVEETSKPGSSLQPEQLAQLASSLLDQPKQLSSVPSNSSGEDSRRLNAMSHSGASYNQGSVQQQPPNPYVGPQSDFQVAASQVNQSASSQDEEQDPQKRLQATLQLAAALLQQIQQGKGT